MQFPVRQKVIKKTLLILFFMLLAAFPRVLSMRSTHLAPGGDICFADPDAYYYLRMARERLGEEHALVMTDEGLTDTLRYAPDGMKDTIPLLSAFTAAVQRALEPLLHCSLEQTANRLTVLLPSLTVLPILLMLGVLLSDLGLQDMYVPAAAVAAVISSVNIGFLRRSTSGRYDTDVLIPFFAGMLILLHYRIVRLSGLKTTEPAGEAAANRPQSSTVRPAGQLVLYIVLLTLTEGLFGRWWNAHLFFTGLIAGISILLAAARLYQQYRRGRGRYEAFPWLCLLLPLPALPAGQIIVGGRSGFLRAVKGVADLFHFSADSSLSEAEAWFPNALVSVKEMAAPILMEGGIYGLFRTYSPNAENLGLINCMGGVTVCVAALLFWILWSFRILRRQARFCSDTEGIPAERPAGDACRKQAGAGDTRRKTDPQIPYLYMTVWTVCTLVLGLRAVRFFMFPAMPVSLLAALFTAEAGMRLRKRYRPQPDELPGQGELLPRQDELSRRLSDGGRIRCSRFLHSFVLWLAVLAIVFPTLYGAFRFARRGSGTFVSDDLWGAAEYLRTETAGDAIAASWWDYGYYYEYAGHKATIFDGGSQTDIRLYWVSRAMADPDRALSKAILRMTSGTGDHATEWLLKKLGSGEEAAALLRQILSLNRGEARRFLTQRHGFTSDEADELLLLSHPELSRDVLFIFSSNMADIAGWYPYFGFWKEEGAPSKKDFRPIASLEEGTLPAKGINTYLLTSSENESKSGAENETGNTVRLEVRINRKEGAADPAAVSDTAGPEGLPDGTETAANSWLSASLDDGRPIRRIWYAAPDGSTYCFEGSGDTLRQDSENPDDGTMADADLVLLCSGDGLQIWLLPVPLSDSLCGELYYRGGLWQDDYELLKAPGTPPWGITASVWKMR